MNIKSLFFSLTGLAVGLIVGFIMANAAVRAGMVKFAPSSANENEAPGGQNSARPERTSENDLSKDEIQSVLEQADKKPDDFELQRNLGLSLYQYARQRGEIDFLPSVKNVLERANRLRDTDAEVLSALGDICFVLAGQTNDFELYGEARSYYQNAAKLNPDDHDLRTNLGSTHLFVHPPEPEKAVAEYDKVLKQNPLHEPALQRLVGALLLLKRIEDAEMRFEELKKLNPKNPALADLEIQLAQSRIE